MDALPKRQVAYKVWIKDIFSAESKSEDGKISFFIKDKQVGRVNIIASVIEDSVVGTYGSLVVDDGSSQIRLKVWNDDLWLLEGKQVGDFVLIVGRINEFNGERYIRPEIIRLISFDWALLRRLELIKEFGIPSIEEKVAVSSVVDTIEVEPSLAARERILEVIDKFDDISENDLVKECGMNKDKVLVALYELLKEGEIFSPKKGYYSLV